MGRKSSLFCWTELGAKQVGIIQSLIVTCRLHGIDPYTYLIDVLQACQPASRLARRRAHTQALEDALRR
jgi:transposase